MNVSCLTSQVRCRRGRDGFKIGSKHDTASGLRYDRELDVGTSKFEWDVPFHSIPTMYFRGSILLIQVIPHVMTERTFPDTPVIRRGTVGHVPPGCEVVQAHSACPDAWRGDTFLGFQNVLWDTIFVMVIGKCFLGNKIFLVNQHPRTSHESFKNRKYF